MLVNFTKMHGLGNDFVVIDQISHAISLSSEQIRMLGDRHFGIGFDQLLMIAPPKSKDVEFNYRIFNCDGTEVEHCGNGARCFARYVLDKGLTVSHNIRVQTARGVIVLSIQGDGQVRVDMGAPNFDPASLPFKGERAADYESSIELAGESTSVRYFAVSVGNPHAVIVVDDIDTAQVSEIGRALGSHPDFPKGVNVGFMQIVDQNNIRLRVFERGVGETLACGTGACAAVSSGIAAGLLNESVTASLIGGNLEVSWTGGTSAILMTGPATTVFEGSIEI